MATGSRMLAAVMTLAKPVFKAARCHHPLALATPIRAVSARISTHNVQPTLFVRRAWSMPLRTFASAPVAAQASSSIYVGNLPYSATEVDLRDWFGEIGEVSGVRLGMDQNGRARGFAHIDFVDARSAAKAVEYDGEQMNGRTLRIDLSTPRAPRERTPADADGLTCFVKGFATDSIDEAREALTEAFSEYGEVKEVILPINRDTGTLKGFGYVVFTEADGAHERAADALQGASVAGGRLTTDPNATSQRRAPAANRGPTAEGDGKTLFVKGFDVFLGEDVVRESLTDLFSAYGTVTEVRLPVDRLNNCLKGFGYVTYAAADGSVARATESLAGVDCAGGSLFIDPNPRPPRAAGGRGDRGSNDRRGGYNGDRRNNDRYGDRRSNDRYGDRRSSDRYNDRRNNDRGGYY